MTRALFEAGHDGPIFEATLAHDSVLVHVDVLEPDGDGWRLAEVKSSTRVKDFHIGDLATQVWVARQAGLTVTGAVIRHVDKAFVLEREGAYLGLFADADVMAEVEPIAAGRGEVVASARAILAAPSRRLGRAPIAALPSRAISPAIATPLCRRDPSGR